MIQYVVNIIAYKSLEIVWRVWVLDLGYAHVHVEIKSMSLNYKQIIDRITFSINEQIILCTFAGDLILAVGQSLYYLPDLWPIYCINKLNHNYTHYDNVQSLVISIDKTGFTKMERGTLGWAFKVLSDWKVNDSWSDFY